jgi:MFS family permease
MVEFALFETPRFTGAAVVAFVGNWMFGAIIFFLTLYLQEVLELTPIQAGLIFLAFTIPLTVMSPMTGRMVARYGAQPLMALGMACIALSFICFAFIGGAARLALVIAGLVISGFGQGFAFNISNSAGMEAISREKAGIASGVLSTIRLMGIIIGLAISGMLFRGLEHQALLAAFARAGTTPTSDTRSEVLGLLSGSEAAEKKLATLAPALQDRIEAVTDYAFTRGFRAVMVVCAVLSGISVWPALAGARRPKKVTSATGPTFLAR